MLPAYGIPVTPTSKLGFRYAAIATPDIVTLTAQFMDRQGHVGSVGPINVDDFTIDRSVTPSDFIPISNHPGWIVDAHLDLVGTVKRGEFYAMATVLQSGYNRYLMKGYLYSFGPLPMGEFVEASDGQGRIVDNEGATTLGNNDTVTRTVAVPTGARWILRNIHILNADNVDRNIDVSITDATNGLLQLWRGSVEANAITPAGEYLNLPATRKVNDDNVVADGSLNLSLKAADEVTIVWNAGGASAGGTARSAINVEEWIEI